MTMLYYISVATRQACHVTSVRWCVRCIQ